jgi:hypothetical protein
MGRNIKSRNGEINFNNFGSKMIIEKYNHNLDIWVRFIGKGNLVHTTFPQFHNGSVKNPYDRTVCGVGYVGEGEYKVSINRKHTEQYAKWRSMLERCYNRNLRQEYTTYKDCESSDEWLNFQNFAKWYDENYYEIEGEKMCLDKDILVKGNKIYSSETCVFVPEKINLLFVKCNTTRGNLPIGVSWNKQHKKYVAKGSDKCKYVHLGFFETPEEAFNAYKLYKEKHIKQVAEEYKDRIPLKLYNALINYKVEIND